MSEATWWRHLHGDPTGFLLADDEPGVVWRALIEVFDRPHESPAVVRSRTASRTAGAAAALLARQDPLGYWGSPHGYGARWSGSAWHVIALAALGADPEDPRAMRAAGTLLDGLQPRSGGFSVASGRPPAACFTAEVCAALAAFGFAHHPRVREAAAWLVERDGGAGPWSCPELRHLHGGACPVAAVAALRLVATLPPEERAPLHRLTERAGRWLMDVGMFLDAPEPRGWLTFAHPCLARADLLAALWALSRAGWKAEPPILNALLAVLARQDAGGRWTAASRVPFGEPAGTPSRWVTLKALVALASYGGSLEIGRGARA